MPCYEVTVRAIVTAALGVSGGVFVIQIGWGASMREGVHAGIYRWTRNAGAAVAALLWAAAALVALVSAVIS